MGWTSTSDPYANVGDAGLTFESREAAIAFAKKHGWEYSVSASFVPRLMLWTADAVALSVHFDLQSHLEFCNPSPSQSLNGQVRKAYSRTKDQFKVRQSKFIMNM
jgi:hypothetical protein